MVKEHIAKISKDTLLVLAFNTVNYLSSFLLAVLISRFLGIETFGEYSFIFAFVLILGMISDFGLSTLLVRKVNENKFIAKELIRNYNLIKVLMSLVITTLVSITVFIFFNKYFYAAFLIGIMIILPRSITSTYESSLRSFLNQKYPVVIKSLNSFLQLFVSYLLLINGSGLAGIFICILFLDALTSMILYFANNKVIQRFYNDNSETANELSSHFFRKELIPTLSESSVFFFNNFLMLSIKSLNVILLGYFSTAASVGIYSAGSRFVNGVGLFSGALFNSFYPVISNIKNNMKVKVDVTKKFISYAFTFGLILTAGVFFLSEYLIGLTFKTEESVIVLKILSSAMLPVLIYTVTQSFMFSAYGEKYLTKILVIAWSLNIIMSIILITLYDYTGCAVALTLTEIFLMFTQLYKFNSDIKIN
ncbi:MAG: flippase [Ignavibacteria bacterium]|nr:flippase [Ignavibacteria bacterium]